MGHALSMDLRSRLLTAIDGGMSCRAVATRFGVAPSTAIRWEAQRRQTGNYAPKPQGGDMRSPRVEERCADILAIWETRKDISLEELRLALIEIGLKGLRCRASSLLRASRHDAQKRLAMQSNRTAPMF